LKSEIISRNLQKDENNDSQELKSTEETEGEGDEESGIREGDGVATSVADGGTGDYGEGAGAHGGIQSKPSVPLRYRTFLTDYNTGTYRLRVRAEQDGNQELYLVVSTIGDDKKEKAEIVSAHLQSGSNIPIESTGIIGPMRLDGEKFMQIDLVLSEPLRVAMEVVGYEA